MDTQTDDWTLLAASKRDHKALGVLFDRYKDYVYRLSYGFIGDETSAEDAVQEVFLRLLKSRTLWIRKGKLTTLLYTITLNVSRELKRQRLETAEPDEDQADETNIEDVSSAQDLHNHLDNALAQLPERQREVVVLRYLQGLSTQETAQIMNCGNGTVKTHLHRAMQRLQTLLSDVQTHFLKA